MRLKLLIEDVIKEEIKLSGYKEFYREPVIGYASAQDPGFDSLSDIIGYPHAKPSDILEGAQTVIVFFLPYSLELIKKIQGPKVIVPEWSIYYTKTNALLVKIASRLTERLSEIGIRSAGEPPTDNFDPVKLYAKWSNKSIAVMAGIGTFGLNHLLITKSGTAGRINTLVMDAYVDPTPKAEGPYCLYYKTGKCMACVRKCPSGALTENGYDRHRCNAYLDGKNTDLLEQGCCACSSGPCASRGF